MRSLIVFAAFATARGDSCPEIDGLLYTIDLNAYHASDCFNNKLGPSKCDQVCVKTIEYLQATDETGCLGTIVVPEEIQNSEGCQCSISTGPVIGSTAHITGKETCRNGGMVCYNMNYRVSWPHGIGGDIFTAEIIGSGCTFTYNLVSTSSTSTVNSDTTSTVTPDTRGDGNSTIVTVGIVASFVIFIGFTALFIRLIIKKFVCVKKKEEKFEVLHLSTPEPEYESDNELLLV